MAILGNLIVQGTIRALNKIYTQDLDVAQTLTVTSLNTSGDIQANGFLKIGNNKEKAIIYLNNKKFATATDDWLRIDPDSSFPDGLLLHSNIVRIDGEF